jgi:hypothetical protein
MSLVLALIDALKRANQTVPDAEQLADAVWLAYYLNPIAPKEQSLPYDLTNPPEAERTTFPLYDTPVSEEPSSKPNRQPAKPEDTETRDAQPATHVDLHAPDYGKKTEYTPGPPATMFPTPGAAALPHKLDISRSLRPLIRYVPSQSRTVLDEQESAELMAETGLPLLSLRPEKERWLNGIVLVDTWPSMAVWLQTAQEFTQLLTQLGAFRRLQSYVVTTTIEVGSNIPTADLKGWQASANPRVVEAKELIDPTGRTLIYLLTDFASPAWATGAMGELLDPLAQQNHLSVVSLIPDSHWSRTILSDGTAVRLQAPHPNSPNHKLAPHFPLWYDDEETKGIKAKAICPPLPLTILDPHALTYWAQFFVGKPTATVPGYYLPQTSKPPKPKQERELTEKLWEHFVATTPREVRRLAAYLTTVPLTLPVIRLVQETMLPQLTQADLARLLDSYLIYPVNEMVAVGETNALQWEFIEGARERLRTTLPSYRLEEVFREVSRYIEKHSQGRYNFHSYIFLPDGNDNTLTGVDDAFGQAFARIALSNLRHLGDKYEKVAIQLQKDIQTGNTTNKNGQAGDIPAHLLRAYDEALASLQDGKFQATCQDLANLLDQLPDEDSFKAKVRDSYHDASQKLEAQLQHLISEAQQYATYKRSSFSSQRSYWQKVLDIDPENITAKEALAKLDKTEARVFATRQKMTEIAHQMSEAVANDDLLSASVQVRAIGKLATSNKDSILQQELDELVNKLTQQQVILRNKVGFKDAVPGRLRDEDDGGKFVGREREINLAEQWRKSGQRLLIITGIPGMGKSWLLKHLAQLWDAEPATLIHYFDLQPFINAYQSRTVEANFHESVEFREAIRKFIEICDVGLFYDEDKELDEQMVKIAELLCEKSRHGHSIYIFVDGIDDISSDEWGNVEATLIEPLCRCENIRFVISVKESQKIQSFVLRSQEERLELAPLTKEEGRKQLKLLGINDKQVDDLIAQGYQLEHPGINTFLARKIPDAQPHLHIDVNFLRELLSTLYSITIQHSDDLDNAIKLLLSLVDLPDQWSFPHYKQHHQLTINKAWEEIDFLQLHYLVIFVPNSAQLYTVVPGLLPFLRIARKNMSQNG